MIKKLKTLNLNKYLKGWKGATLYTLAALFLAWYFNILTPFFFLFIVIIIPLIHFHTDPDTLAYAFLGVVLSMLTYGILGPLINTKLPVVAVVSTSMLHDSRIEETHYKWLYEHLGYTRQEIDSWPIKDGFDRGDVLIVVGVDPKDLKVGDVIVFDANQGYPVVHRIIKINDDGTFETKGDHNPLQLPFEHRIRPEQIYGKVVFVIPKLGYVKILVMDLFNWLFRR